MEEYSFVLRGVFGLGRGNAGMGARVVTNVAAFLTVTCVLTVGPSCLNDVRNTAPNTVLANATISTTVTALYVTFFTGCPITLTSNVKLGTFFTFAIYNMVGVPCSITLATVLIRNIVFLLLSFFGFERTLIGRVPRGLGFNVATKVNLFVAVVTLVGSNIIIGGSSALISVNDFGDPTFILSVMKLLVVKVLHRFGIPNSVLLNVVTA